MIIQDDRTDEQKSTHRWAWVMTDRFMSGWGPCEGGTSYAGWAFADGDDNACESWVRSRGESMRVRLVNLSGYKPSRCAHCHIYVYKRREV